MTETVILLTFKTVKFCPINHWIIVDILRLVLLLANAGSRYEAWRDEYQA